MDVNLLTLTVLFSVLLLVAGEEINLNNELEEEKEITDAVKDYVSRMISNLEGKYESRIQNLESTIKVQEKQMKKLKADRRVDNFIISKLERKLKVLETKSESLEKDYETEEITNEREKDISKIQKSVEYDTEQNQTKVTQVPRTFVRRVNVATQVAFFAYMSTRIVHLGENQDIVFDHAVTNIGNAYNERHGNFIAPAAGTYVFSVTLTHYDSVTSGGTWGVLKVNDARVAILYMSNEQSSQTIVVTLVPGDDVSVRNIVSGASLYGDHHSTFSGFLLYESAVAGAVVG